MTNTMRRSWLVQRLNKPRMFGLAGMKDKPFSFGGGYKNGGLSDDAMDLIRGIFSFDYMGAAEFEFGEVPKALSRIAAQQTSLVAAEVKIPLATVEPDWRNRDPERSEGDATVYVLAAKPDLTEVKKRIRSWAKKDHTMKESTRLPRTLVPASEYDGDTVGWLELDNGFFFFTDREMWEQTCELFGVKVPAVTR